jgi:hypothetical protein
VGKVVIVGAAERGVGNVVNVGAAERGVGNVAGVVTNVADLGVVMEAENGLNGDRDMGESSTRPSRDEVSTAVLLDDTRRPAEICRFRIGAEELDVGITSGVNVFGDAGGRAGSF